MLHGTWIRLPGALRGISPLEALRLGDRRGDRDAGARRPVLRAGRPLSFGVEVPGAMDDQKKNDCASPCAKYAGLSNSHAIGVLTNGAKFVTGLAPTPEQAQFLETRKFGVEEVCRIYGVPPNMVGSQEPGASSYASADVYDKQFAERAVLPLAVRIEAQHDRLLELPDGSRPTARSSSSSTSTASPG
jgi:phage portal protein BeeE